MADYLVSAVVSASCMEARHEGQDTVLQGSLSSAARELPLT